MHRVLIGAHVRTDDDPLGAAAACGADVVQLFLGDPQSWKKPAPAPAAEAKPATPAENAFADEVSPRTPCAAPLLALPATPAALPLEKPVPPPRVRPKTPIPFPEAESEAPATAIAPSLSLLIVA